MNECNATNPWGTIDLSDEDKLIIEQETGCWCRHLGIRNINYSTPGEVKKLEDIENFDIFYQRI